jgi:hypothetical protein
MPKIRNKNMFLFGLFWLAVAMAILAVPREVHEHADFAVYLNGERFNFTQEKYMSDENHTFGESTHVHDMRGNVIHKHVAGATIGDFFSSLDMTFNSTAFATDDGTEYGSVRMFVNGKENNMFEKYEFRDLDRILIAAGNYGSKEIQAMAVTDEACIESGKCPERGSPSDESCSTGGICIV